MTFYLSATDVYLVLKCGKVDAIRISKNRVRELVKNELLNVGEIDSLDRLVLVSGNHLETTIYLDPARTAHSFQMREGRKRVHYHFFVSRDQPVEMSEVFPWYRYVSSNRETIEQARKQARKDGRKVFARCNYSDSR